MAKKNINTMRYAGQIWLDIWTGSEQLLSAGCNQITMGGLVWKVSTIMFHSHFTVSVFQLFTVYLQFTVKNINPSWSGIVGKLQNSSLVNNPKKFLSLKSFIMEI